jgi:hypothetical protein
VLGVEQTKGGYLPALPYLIMFVASNAGGWVADALIQRRVSVTRTRKIVNSCGFAVTGMAMTALPYVRSLHAMVRSQLPVLNVLHKCHTHVIQEACSSNTCYKDFTLTMPPVLKASHG